MEPPESELKHADGFSPFVEVYRPLPETEENSNGVGLANAIQMINKYCAKLPSDTFTKLTPLWRCAKTIRNGHDLFQYTIRMPINSPLKEDILVSVFIDWKCNYSTDFGSRGSFPALTASVRIVVSS